jgi:hypothetical protein
VSNLVLIFLHGGSLLQNITDNKKTISNLINGVQYYFVVTAVKDTFESGGSGEATATSIGALNDTGITWGGGYATSNNATCTGVEISAQEIKLLIVFLLSVIFCNNEPPFKEA